ncbi:MAG: DUF5329 domain-containing protein [Xanthomonadales bacterium]|nr:DUF5329 domain-containing protein [Xanthomonadales bacterium]
MNHRSRFVIALAACALSLVANAAAAAPAAKAQHEIDALIAGLGSSGCEFERNGSWHDAKAARAHLQKKYDYLRKRDMADTAELFIERAASKSSMSGKAYRVRCPGKTAEPSERWFRQRLQALRAAPTR